MSSIKCGRGTAVARIVLVFLVVLCCFFISWNSAADGETSDSVSAKVTDTVVHVTVKDYDTMPETDRQNLFADLHRTVREMAHALEFAALGFLVTLLILTFERELCPDLPSHVLRYVGCLGFCVLYAVLDEVHQLFVDGRAFQWFDVGVDTLGACIGTGFALFVGWLFSRLRHRSVKP